MKGLHVLRGPLIGAAILLFVCARVQAAARFADAADDVAHLYEAIEARLLLMPDVAAWKWANQRAVADDERERAMLASVAARARELGLASEPVQRVFEVQIKMARAMQTALFETWRENGFPDNRPLRDLNSDLRPSLDALNESLIAALYWARDELPRATPTDTISKTLRRIASLEGVTAQDLAELRAALHELRAEGSRIDAIARLRVLRIGTTGDYAPFSSETNGALEGLDIELGEALGAHLGLAVRFVRTTWPTLMNDLQADRFDVALSGVSNTPERAARAEFSTAYHFDGKTPIARCADRGRFGSLSDIDQSPVRLIVNPGGTNEQFARERVKYARIVMHADNRTIFDEIIAGRADVMITDGIEVELQTRRHKELCRTMSGTLTNSAKAILLPRGSQIAKPVDQWLQGEIARGGVQEKLQRALKADAHND